MMTAQQSVLPFNQYTGQHLSVQLRGPKTTPQFVATGGLLHAYNPHTNEPLPHHEYPQPTEDLWDHESQPALPDIPFEETVAAYVEYTAQILFELIQDTAELERVIDRFRYRSEKVQGRSRGKGVIESLHDEQTEVNTYFGEVLENYCLQLGANAAEELAQWVAQTAEFLDTPAPGTAPGNPGSCGNKDSVNNRDPRGFYEAGPQ